jgi:hypothetical protein
MISSSRKRCREKGRILFEGSRKEGAVLLDGLREVFVIGEEGLGRVIRRRHGWYKHLPYRQLLPRQRWLRTATAEEWCQGRDRLTGVEVANDGVGAEPGLLPRPAVGDAAGSGEPEELP